MALVDDADFEWLNQWKWYAVNRRGNFYAFRNIATPTGQTIIQMHRQILHLKPRDGNQADHINHETLDNQSNNLRVCTNQTNAFNKTPFIGGTSEHKGVHWDKTAGKWQAQIGYNGRRYNLGRFKNECDAAQAYNEAAAEFFGEFAYKSVI